MDRHRLAEEISIALHREVAAHLRDDPTVLERARNRVQSWLQTGEVSPFYAEQWARALDGPMSELCRLLVDDSESARALRQSSPFAGALDPRVRWRIWREVRAARETAWNKAKSASLRPLVS